MVLKNTPSICFSVLIKNYLRNTSSFLKYWLQTELRNIFKFSKVEKHINIEIRYKSVFEKNEKNIRHLKEALIVYVFLN